MKKFRTWIKEGCVPVLTCLIAVVIFACFMVFTDEFASVIRRCVGYFVTMVCILAPMYVSTTYNQTLPLTMSFGFTRKEARKGLLMARLIPVALCVIIMPIMVFAAFRISAFRSISLVAFYIGMLMTSSALGSMISCKQLQNPGSKALRLARGVVALLGLAPVILTSFIAFKDASVAEDWILFFGIGAGVLVVIGIALQIYMWKLDERVLNRYNVNL